MKVLLVNHTSTVSGAEISLLELLAALPDEVSAVVACPDGELAQAVRRLGITVSSIPEIEASFRPHPLHTPRGIGQIIRSGLAVRRLARETGSDLVHANSIRAGLAVALAARLGGPPTLVHVRDCLPPNPASNLIRRFIGSGAAMILANSRYTAENFRGDGFRGRIETIYSPVDLQKFDPERVDRYEARASLALGGDVPLIGVVGQITPWKGQDTAIRALALLRRRLPDARLLIVGKPKFLGQATRYGNAAYLRSLERMVEELGLQDHVSFLGERRDIPELLCAFDILIVPSWEEPFGRTVVEAMAMETPVIATSVGGPAEIIEDGRSGRLLSPRRPELWAEAVEALLANPKLCAKMALNGRERAKRFTQRTHVDSVVAAYREALARSDGKQSKTVSTSLKHEEVAG